MRLPVEDAEGEHDEDEGDEADPEQEGINHSPTVAASAKFDKRNGRMTKKGWGEFSLFSRVSG